MFLGVYEKNSSERWAFFIFLKTLRKGQSDYENMSNIFFPPLGILLSGTVAED